MGTLLPPGAVRTPQPLLDSASRAKSAGDTSAKMLPVHLLWWLGVAAGLALALAVVGFAGTRYRSSRDGRGPSMTLRLRVGFVSIFVVGAILAIVSNRLVFA